MRITRRILIYPWNLNGYVKLSWGGKQKIIRYLISEYGSYKNINNQLSLSPYWFNNFKRNDKINTRELKKIVDVTNLSLVDDIIQFNDDNGASSISYLGKFPIKYNPLWHFLFCLSVGDGHIRKDSKKRFTWYQKQEGQEKVIELLNRMNFGYKGSVKSTKQGITIPQMVRKVGSYVTGLDSSESIKQNIISASAKLGKDFELAFLCAFFIDEAGMGKSKLNSEITLHQEGNLILLEKLGNLLNKFNVKWSKNKKQDKWCIRISSEGVIQLSKLFTRLRVYNIDLLHRRAIFEMKAKIAVETVSIIPLRNEAISARKSVLVNYKGQLISLKEMKTLFPTGYNITRRAKKLAKTMRIKKELEPISLETYMVKGE